MSLNQRKKILVLRYRFIGDTILTVPFFRNLRRAEPEAHIAWVVAPGSSDVVKGIPYVDELIYWDPATIHADSRGGHRTLGAKLSFIRELRAKKFDKAYVLKRSFSSALIALLSGARERVGFDTEGRRFMLTRAVPYRPEQHEVVSFLDLLRADGVPVTDDYLESWISADEARKADELLQSHGVGGDARLLALHPFGSIYQKSWPMARFAEVARQLMERYGMTPLLLGAGGDRKEFEPWRHLFPHGCCDLVGGCDLRTTLALLHRSALFLGNDSGVMHLAASAGVPLLALFGPTSPDRFGPWGSRTRVIHTAFPCSPCRQKYFTQCEPAGEGRPECIMAISVEQVCQACEELIKETEVR